MEQGNIGLIGLGNIGKPLALRLAQSQFVAHVYDVYLPVMKELSEAGATACASIADLTQKCAHIGICVRDDAEVDVVLSGDGGVLANAARDTLVAIHSTVTQANIFKWAERASALGLHLLDAPITGGAHKAADGTLCYMVGGDAGLVERCRPVFETSAEKIIHAGELGTGIALKLANNFIQFGEFVLMAEASRLAEACGLNSDTLRDVGLANGVVNEQMHMFVSGRNAMARSLGAEQMEQFFGPLGRLGRKDLECALQTASDKGVKLPTAEYLRDRIEQVFLAQDESKPIE